MKEYGILTDLGLCAIVGMSPVGRAVAGVHETFEESPDSTGHGAG